MNHVFLYAIFYCIFFGTIANAQTCQGTLGDPIEGAGTDFGRGSANYGPALGTDITTYRYISGSPNDGGYTLAKTTRTLNGGWHQDVVNHTPNDPNGYMMIVNAEVAQGTFYTKTVNNLCPKTTYEFSAWIINILRNTGIRPNVKFVIENTSPITNTKTTIKEFSTGDILEGSVNDWKFYGTIFVTPDDLGIITLTMLNINPGGLGNDLAIDDIAFRACGPSVTTSANNTALEMCAGESRAMRFSASVSAGYATPTYMWQRQVNNVWIDVPSETGLNYDYNFSNSTAGTYRFRLLVAEQGNLQSVNCRIASIPITIVVNELPTPTVSSNGNICEGSEIKLSASSGNSFLWTGPNNFSSTQQNPTISNAVVGMSGTYTVVVTNSSGCQATLTTNVTVYPILVASGTSGTVELCEGKSMQLSASGGSIYKWSPAVGLSNPNIANPIASPTVTTTYTVAISNGGCEDRISVTINVLSKPSANAGEDGKIMEGKSITLNGLVNGSRVRYQWQPTDFLDDPTKLNPIAKPTRNITYTLTAQNDCEAVSDDVTIQVLPTIEIPSAFSPNGDNTNDTWNIPAISLFPSAKLTIFDRSGQIVYEGDGTSAPWDGKNKGKDSPVGTYYYRLYLSDEYKLFSGWVLLVR